MERLDKVLVQNGFFETRTKAENAILAKQIKVDNVIIDKPGKKINPESIIEFIGVSSHYVSRGAYKLLHALDFFNLNPKDQICMDLGASTGGFTQVLLEKGCQKVYCVDVGKGQLHHSLLEDSRTVNLEKTHIKDLCLSLIEEALDAVVVDVSFISLTKVIHYLPLFLKENGIIIALIKPQFEVGKENLSKGGIVRNEKLYPLVLDEIKNVAEKNGLKWIDAVTSPILGGDGNKEFLCYLRKTTGVDI